MKTLQGSTTWSLLTLRYSLCYTYYMIELREHQLSILSTLQENRKGQVIVPTGGGKTMCMIEDT